MSEAVWIALIGFAGTTITLFIAWLRERGKDRLTEEEIEERISKSRLATIAELQAQLGTATEASGKLREELDRSHSDIERMQVEITGLHQQLASNAETIAAQAETNAQLQIDKRESVNEKAIWQRKYLDALLERDSFLELLRTLKERSEIVGELKEKIDAMEKRLSAVQNDTGKLKRKADLA